MFQSSPTSQGRRYVIERVVNGVVVRFQSSPTSQGRRYEGPSW